MSNVIDVTTSGDPDAAVLTETTGSGVLGGSYLHEEPLEAYLGEAEVPQYVIRNKRSGVVVERPDGEESIEPSGDYQALGLVTDVRVVFVVGTEDGDRSLSIPLADLVTVDVEQGMLSGELTLTTSTDIRYAFPCRGDLEGVAAYVDEGSQAWARAYTLLENARAAIQDAQTHRMELRFTDAIDAIDEGAEAVEDARERLAAFGEGAARSLAGEAEDVADLLERRRRAIHADHGVHAHEQGRDAWGNREYEAADDRFREAEAALERALNLEHSAEIADRLDRLREEWEALAEAPLDYAEVMVDEAAESTDPLAAAQCWEVAIERYRDAYALDWGREAARFEGDPDEIRGRILDATEAVVQCRLRAVDERIDEAEWFHESGDREGAIESLEEALTELDRTRELVDELRQDQDPELVRAREDVEDLLAAFRE